MMMIKNMHVYIVRPLSQLGAVPYLSELEYVYLSSLLTDIYLSLYIYTYMKKWKLTLHVVYF
mgnify:CR=1 FL=1